MIKNMGVKEMGKLIRDLRINMTQEDLEAMSGVSQGMISRLERGEIQRPNLSFVRQIARSLEAPYDEFIAALHGVSVTALEEQDVIHKWLLLDLPPDIDDDEILMLKHLFRGIRGYEEEALERESSADAPPASRIRRQGRGRAAASG